jgi:hypothetical protein
MCVLALKSVQRSLSQIQVKHKAKPRSYRQDMSVALFVYMNKQRLLSVANTGGSSKTYNGRRIYLPLLPSNLRFARDNVPTNPFGSISMARL